MAVIKTGPAMAPMLGSDTADDDLFAIWDKSAGTWKNIARAELILSLAMSGFATVTEGTETDLSDDAFGYTLHLVIDKDDGAPHQVDLPDNNPDGPGRNLWIVDGKGDAETNPITVSGKLNGSTTYTTINTNRGWLHLLDAGATWIVIG